MDIYHHFCHFIDFDSLETDGSEKSCTENWELQLNISLVLTRFWQAASAESCHWTSDWTCALVQLIRFMYKWSRFYTSSSTARLSDRWAQVRGLINCCKEVRGQSKQLDACNWKLKSSQALFTTWIFTRTIAPLSTRSAAGIWSPSLFM